MLSERERENEVSRCVFLDENVFNELTEKEVRAHLNAIALPADEQVRIKADVKNLLDQ